MNDWQLLFEAQRIFKIYLNTPETVAWLKELERLKFEKRDNIRREYDNETTNKKSN